MKLNIVVDCVGLVRYCLDCWNRSISLSVYDVSIIWVNRVVPVRLVQTLDLNTTLEIVHRASNPDKLSFSWLGSGLRRRLIVYC